MAAILDAILHEITLTLSNTKKNQTCVDVSYLIQLSESNFRKKMLKITNLAFIRLV